MAEIRIDRKSGPSPWIWVVAGLVVVALVVWGVLEFTGGDRRADDTAPATTPAAEQYQVEPQPYTPATPDDPAAPRDPAVPPGPGTP